MLKVLQLPKPSLLPKPTESMPLRAFQPEPSCGSLRDSDCGEGCREVSGSGCCCSFVGMVLLGEKNAKVWDHRWLIIIFCVRFLNIGKERENMRLRVDHSAETDD